MFLVLVFGFGQVLTSTVFNAMLRECIGEYSIYLAHIVLGGTLPTCTYIVECSILTSRFSGLMASSICSGSWGTLLLIQKICKSCAISRGGVIFEAPKV